MTALAKPLQRFRCLQKYALKSVSGNRNAAIQWFHSNIQNLQKCQFSTKKIENEENKSEDMKEVLRERAGFKRDKKNQRYFVFEGEVARQQKQRKPRNIIKTKNNDNDSDDENDETTPNQGLVFLFLFYFCFFVFFLLVCAHSQLCVFVSLFIFFFESFVYVTTSLFFY